MAYQNIEKKFQQKPHRYDQKSYNHGSNEDPDMDLYARKIVIIFLPINLNMFFGAKKNGLIETVLLSNHNIFFG